MKVSIVIPTYNHCSDLLSPCLESVLKYTDLNDTEIIVVANGCTDNTQEYLADKPIKLVWSDELLGYTKAVNEGIGASTGEYIILLNNDVVLLEQKKHKWIDILLEPFSDPLVAITGPMKSYCPYAQRDMIIFFCACIKREIFDKFGLLDEVFSPGWGEDTDLCCKVTDAGYKIVQVCPSDKYYEHNRMIGEFPIYHKGGETLIGLPDPHGIIKRNSQKLTDRYAVKIEKATYCDGYMSDIELRWLGGEAKKHRIIIEVGSWCGRSTRALGDNTSGVIYAIDHFNGSKTEPGLHTAAQTEEGDHAFIDFCNNNFDLIQKGRIIPLRGTSANMAKLLKKHGVKTDMIFIDGGHTYEEVKQDIENWRDLLTDDGLFCGHDARAWAGVDRAIGELLHRYYIGENTTIWFCEKKDIRTEEPAELRIETHSGFALYDCFIFNDELDILDKRFVMLYDMVDRFVIVEGTRTFAGKPKPLHFRENLDRFKKYLNKVNHVVVDDFPDSSPFGMENHQRDCIMRGLTQCRDTDAIIITDCDEIPNATAIRRYKPEHGVWTLEMDLHYYNMHVKSLDKWRHPRILPFSVLKRVGPGGARYAEQAGLNPQVIPDAGKHMSFFGDAAVAIKKMEEYSHQEYNLDRYKDPAKVREAIDRGVDLFGRKGIKFIKTDRLSLDDAGIKYGTQKCSLCHDFLIHYERALHLRPVKVVIEIGVDRGASLRTWAEFFPDARIYGVDVNSQLLFDEGNIWCVLGDQARPDQIRDQFWLNGIEADLFVDDGSHVWSHQIETYETIFPMMRSGSIYIVEDLHTSFIPEYRDRGEGQLSPLRYFSARENFDIIKTNNGASITGIGIKG